MNIDKRRRALEQAEDELRQARSSDERRTAERRVRTARKDLRDAEHQGYEVSGPRRRGSF